MRLYNGTTKSIVLSYHRHAPLHRLFFLPARLVVYHHRIYTLYRVHAVPAEGDFFRAEHQRAPAVVDFHAVFLHLVGVAEDREEKLVLVVVVRGEGVGQVELLRAMLVIHVHRVPVGEALVAHFHTVGARPAYEIGGLRAAVLPQVVAVGNFRVQRQRLAIAQYRVGAEVESEVVEIADVDGVARAKTVVRDDHPVVAVLIDRVGSVGASILPEVLRGVLLRGV